MWLSLLVSSDLADFGVSVSVTTFSSIAFTGIDGPIETIASGTVVAISVA